MDNQDPTTAFSSYWLWAHRPDRGSGGDGGGKWLVFTTADLAAGWWQAVSRETEAGRLGESAKIATARQLTENPRARYVTCVYTLNYSDQADVRRVLAALRGLGVAGPLHYKENSATSAQLYSARYTGNRAGAPASLYASGHGDQLRQLRPAAETQFPSGAAEWSHHTDR